MNLSDDGVAMIEGFEGWARLIESGPMAGCYAAYRESINGKLDRATIGPGITEGVKIGDVWTKDECTAHFKKELAKHERIVERLCQVELNQNEFDALVSFSYNTGELAKSTILKRLNAGDKDGAAKAFAAWNKFGGKPCKALTQRRAEEAALFLKPVEAPEPDYMPQAPEKAPEIHPAVVPTAAVTTGAAAVEVVSKAADQAGTVKQAGDQLGDFVGWASHNIAIVAAVLVCVGVVCILPHLRKA